jgi:hypothetical protein
MWKNGGSKLMLEFASTPLPHLSKYWLKYSTIKYMYSHVPLYVWALKHIQLALCQ